MRVAYPGQAEHLGRVDQRQQVVDLEVEVVGQPGQPVLPAARGQDLQQTGQAARRDLGERHLGRRLG